MKRITLMISLFAALIATVHGQTQRMPSVKPKEGFVPNAETAVKVGEAVLMPVYGEKQILGERPFKAALHGDVWTVEGTLHLWRAARHGVRRRHSSCEDFQNVWTDTLHDALQVG